MSQANKGKTCRPRVSSTDPQSLLEQCNALKQEVTQLQRKLDTELAKGSNLQHENQTLSQELSEMRTQWQRQKTLKEMFINKGKETKRELESLQKYSNPETLSTERIAAQIRNDIRLAKKKDLHRDYEELKVAYITSQEKFKADLQMERKKNAFLQKELDRISAVPHQFNRGHVSDAATIRQEADTLHQQLEKEIQQKNVLLKHFEELQAEHRGSQERFTAELQVEREKNKPLQEELEKIKEVNCKYETDLISLRQQVDTLQRELGKEVQQKQLLQKDFQELQEAHTLSQQKFAAEIQVEEDRKKLLQENLESIKVSHQEISERFDTDVTAVRQEMEQGRHLVESLRAELKDMEQKEMEKIGVLQQDAFEKERCLVREQEELRTQLSFQIERNLELSNELKAEKESKRARHEEKDEDQQLHHQQSLPETHSTEPLNEAENHEEPDVQQESFPEEPALEPLEEASGSSVTAVSEEMSSVKKSAPSVWKRVRHFLCLRKPKGRKK